jgi:hypothetical protein
MYIYIYLNHLFTPTRSPGHHPPRNIPEDPTERVEKAGALLDNLGRSLRTVRESANELANAGAVLAEKGDRLADVASAAPQGAGAGMVLGMLGWT